MTDHQLNVPVLAIIFNRPEMTAQLIAAIARAKPSELYVFADGPRQDHPDDIKKCHAARAATEHPTWPCQVSRYYADTNLGCGRGPASAIAWVFEHTDQAIILEDDCVPHPSGFRFWKELLEKYREDQRIMMIGGRNHLPADKQSRHSYHFSRIPVSWGWATWRRAWHHFDINIPLWNDLKDTDWMRTVLENDYLIQFWRGIFDQMYAAQGDIDAWDYQWVFACWAHSGLAILPNVNLVANIGFCEDSTHTKDANDFRALIPATEIPFPLRHPPCIIWDKEADAIRCQQAIKIRKSLS